MKDNNSVLNCLDVLLPEGATESLNSLKWKGKNKKTHCAFCLLSVTSQQFLTPRRDLVEMVDLVDII